jgi:hypothetical protein
MVRRLHTVVTCAALLMFAWLMPIGNRRSSKIRSISQNFESRCACVRKVLGRRLSGTVPPARALEPLGAFVFVCRSRSVSASTAFTCDEPAHRHRHRPSHQAGPIDIAFAWLWRLSLRDRYRLGNAGCCGPTRCCCRWTGRPRLRRVPTTSRQSDARWLIVGGLFALQLHLVAAVAAPIIVIVAAATFRDARPLRRIHVWALAVAAVVGVGPYLIAEALTGFANTRAILGHLGSAGSGDAGSATMALVIALDPMRVLNALGLGTWPLVIVGAALAIAAVWVAIGSDRVLFWLTVCAVAAIAGQALFFWWMARPFAGYHHVTPAGAAYAVLPAMPQTRAVDLPISMPAHAGSEARFAFSFLPVRQWRIERRARPFVCAHS